jgi:hypothetical protein
MRMLIPFLAMLASGAPVDTAARREMLMHDIEKAVHLPKSAKPLASYGRHYAFLGRDKVEAIYLIPDEIFGKAAADSRAAAGQRRWYERVEDLPSIFDGGCMQVTILYSIPAKRILRVACNGYA